jgi:hypothetical protein
VHALYCRLRSRGTRGDVALGHAMRKLLHLVFAVWTTGRPFDANHYPWEKPPHTEADAAQADGAANNEKTAGHKQSVCSEHSVVTAVSSTLSPTPSQNQPKASAAAPPATPPPTGSIDFAALRQQVRMEQVLAHLGCLSNLKGSGLQRRGACPIHAPGDPRNRSFSVHLGKNVFQCFHPPCAAHGNTLDLWAAAHRLPLYDAAVHLRATFQLDQPAKLGTEKRNT